MMKTLDWIFHKKISFAFFVCTFLLLFVVVLFCFVLFCFLVLLGTSDVTGHDAIENVGDLGCQNW